MVRRRMAAGGAAWAAAAAGVGMAIALGAIAVTGAVGASPKAAAPKTRPPAVRAGPATAAGPAAAAGPTAAARPAPSSAEPAASVLTLADRAVTGVATRLGPWRLAGRSEVLGAYSDQGLATVRTAASGERLVYRGTLSVDGALAAAGWDHVGDPDSWAGWVVDPFQGGPGAAAKMFRFTAPGTGAVTEAVHPLVAGEAANNSFAAVTPDGRWLLSAEWGEESRLLVFPGPATLHLTAAVTLPLAGTVRLDRPVRDLQGCAFATAARLVCATSDPATDLWPVPDQLLAIDLDRGASSGGPPAGGAVSLIGQVPATGACAGAYEPEGVDIDRATGDLRLAVAPPARCNLFTQVYDYRPAPG